LLFAIFISYHVRFFSLLFSCRRELIIFEPSRMLL